MECLIVGLGNIGKIHAKYLTKNNIKWRWCDPQGGGPKDKESDIKQSSKFDRVFITSPECSHYDIYKQVRDSGYNGYIFVEKPVALSMSHINEMLVDDKVIVGMVERFNPAIQTLKSHVDKNQVINIDFSRCCVSHRSSPVSILEDIGIHDIDLLLYLLDIDVIPNYSIINKNNTCIFTASEPLARMIWSKDTFFKERKIIVRQIDCTYEVDLQEQFVLKHWESEGHHVSKSLFVEKSSPIENEHNNFLSDSPNRIDCKSSHEILINLLQRNKADEH